MVSRKTPVPSPVSPEFLEHGSVEPLVIERSADPLQLLANILTVAGALAAQWGEEIVLHLRVASLWLRIGRKERAINYLRGLAAAHLSDTFHLGSQAVKTRIDMMRYFLRLCEIDDGILLEEERSEVKRQNTGVMGRIMFWRKPQVKTSPKIRKALNKSEYSYSTLNSAEEEVTQEIVHPSVTWLENAYLTLVPGDTRFVLVQELNAIKEYGDPDEVAQQLLKLFDHCRGWHERRSDTPIWVHDLDDIGARAMYLAVMVERPGVIISYIERCIDALNERPLALMPCIAIAVGGLGHMAKKQRRDELLHRALDYLPRMPEHERCISALALVETLVER